MAAPLYPFPRWASVVFGFTEVKLKAQRQNFRDRALRRGYRSSETHSGGTLADGAILGGGGTWLDWKRTRSKRRGRWGVTDGGRSQKQGEELGETILSRRQCDLQSAMLPPCTNRDQKLISAACQLVSTVDNTLLTGGSQCDFQQPLHDLWGAKKYIPNVQNCSAFNHSNKRV